MSDQHVEHRKARAARAAITAFAAVMVAAVSHMIAGGNTPSWVAIIGATAVALPYTLLVTRRSFGVAGMSVAVALTQVLFHWLFVFMGVASTQSGSQEPLPAHAEHFGMVSNFVPIIPEAAGASVFMWLSHGVATVVTVWMLRRGEVALTRLARVLTRAFWPAFTDTSDFPTLDETLYFAPSTPVTHGKRAGYAVSHRGPPEERLTALSVR